MADGAGLLDPIIRYGYFKTISERSGLNVPEDALREAIMLVDRHIRSLRVLTLSDEDCARHGVRAGFIQGRIGSSFSAVLVLRNGSLFRHAYENPGLSRCGSQLSGLSYNLERSENLAVMDFATEIFGDAYAAEGFPDPASWPHPENFMDFSVEIINQFSGAASTTSRSRTLSLTRTVREKIRGVADEDEYVPTPKEARFYAMLRSVLEGAGRKRMSWQTAQLRAALNRDTLRCLSRAMLVNMKCYEALEDCCSYETPDDERYPVTPREEFRLAKERDACPDRMLRRSRRVQAVNAYPVFAGVILSLMTEETKPELVTAIDEAAEIIPVLAKMARSSPSQIRETAKISPQVSGLERNPKDPEITQLRIVKASGPGKAPRNRKEWKIAKAAMETMLIGGSEGVVRNVRGKWEDQQRWANDVTHCNDFTKDVKNRIFHMSNLPGCRPMTQGTKDLPLFQRFMDGDRWTLRDNVEMSALWHREFATRRNFIRGFYPEEAAAEFMSWKPFAGTIGTGTGLTAEEVSSQMILSDLGDDQDHCVGGYDEAVMNGTSLIFAIKDASGQVMSTLEMDISDTVPRISQNLARSNRAPAPEADRAAREVQRSLRDMWMDQDRVEKYLEQMSEASEAHSRSKSVFSAGGGKRGDVEFHREFWDRFHSRYMRRGVKGMSFDQAMNRLIAIFKR